MDYQNTPPLKPNFLNNPVLQSRSFIIFVIICVFIFFALGIAGDYYFALPKTKNCTKEAQICPDGSSVGRTGPNCKFAPCPTSKTNNKINYSCPKNGWVNCMPILTDEAKKLCQPEAINWYIANCPGFKGIAQ